MNTSSSTNQFGLMIAYLLPGFIGLAGIAPLAPAVGGWLSTGAHADAGVGPPIYAVLAATTLGMILSAFRWLLIDHLHHWTGLKPPRADFDRVAERLSAFTYAVEHNYRYYQFVANSLVAVVWAYVLNRWNGTAAFGIGTDLAFVVVCATLFAASRNALSRYYARTAQLVGEA